MGKSGNPNWRRDLKPAWKKGQSGNPSGRAKLPDHLKAKNVDRIHAQEIEQIMARFLRMTAEELKAILADPKTTVHELIIGKIVAESIKQGDHHRVDFLYNRLIGRVIQKNTFVDENGEAMPQVVIHLPDNRRHVE